MPRDVVLFDLDGTVLNPGGSIRHALNAAVSFGGFEPIPPAEVLIGMPLREILQTRTADPQLVEAMVGEFRRVHQEDSWRLAGYHEGFPEILVELKAAGFRTGIVTTKGEAEAIHLMESLQIVHLWDTIVGDNDERAIKPDPAPVLAACRNLQAFPQDAVMIGDTSFDMDAGRSAGAWTIGVSWGNGSQWGAAPTSADVVVDDAQQLRAAIDQWHRGHKP